MRLTRNHRSFFVARCIARLCVVITISRFVPGLKKHNSRILRRRERVQIDTMVIQTQKKKIAATVRDRERDERE